MQWSLDKTKNIDNVEISTEGGQQVVGTDDVSGTVAKQESALVVT